MHPFTFFKRLLRLFSTCRYIESSKLISLKIKAKSLLYIISSGSKKISLCTSCEERNIDCHQDIKCTIDVSNYDQQPRHLKRSKRTGGVSGGNTHDPDPEPEPRPKQRSKRAGEVSGGNHHDPDIN